jgi:hypothetical protein
MIAINVPLNFGACVAATSGVIDADTEGDTSGDAVVGETVGDKRVVAAETGTKVVDGDGVTDETGVVGSDGADEIELGADAVGTDVAGVTTGAFVD